MEKDGSKLFEDVSEEVYAAVFTLLQGVSDVSGRSTAHEIAVRQGGSTTWSRVR